MNFISRILTTNVLCYDAISEDILYTSNVNFLNPIIIRAGIFTQFSVHFQKLISRLYSESENKVNFVKDFVKAGF